VNTSIVGSNGVLNRVSEDGILPPWFRHPHRRFGTSHRILNLVVGLQMATIVLSGGNIFLLGEAYAFGVMWSFALKALAVLVLRYKEPGAREFRVPLNFRIGSAEVPVGLAVIAAMLFALCLVNLLTKQVATISGVSFTIVFFAIFTLSEHTTRRRATAQAELDQFNLTPSDDLTPAALGVRPGCVLVPARNYNTLYPLKQVLERVDTHTQDVVVLHLRFLQRAGGGEYELEAEQLFSPEEQKLFTRALALSEKQGKTIHLAVAAATEKWEAILRAAQSLQASMVVVGASPTSPVTEEARLSGLVWERLPDPKPHLTLAISFENGGEHVFYLGPHAPHLTPKEIDLLHGVWLDLSGEVAPEELHHHDIVHYALDELRGDLRGERRAAVIEGVRRHVHDIRGRRIAPPA
jgi:nucleotide-binding universal stress UspA family protein